MRLDTIYFMISQGYFSLCSIRKICDFELDSVCVRYMDNHLWSHHKFFLQIFLYRIWRYCLG